MHTDHPTTTIYFVFAFTFCGVKVYKDEESFLLRLFNNNRLIEVLPEKPKEYQEIDTRLLAHLVFESLKPLTADLDAVSEAVVKLRSTLEQTKQ